jgi:hypothetical protein
MALSWNEQLTTAFAKAHHFGTLFLLPASVIVIGDFNSAISAF